MLVTLFALYMVFSLVYIRHLKKRLRGYEHVWEQIEQVADRNQDGTFTINIQHLEDAHAISEAHTNVDAAKDMSGLIQIPFDTVLRFQHGSTAR